MRRYLVRIPRRKGHSNQRDVRLARAGLQSPHPRMHSSWRNREGSRSAVRGSDRTTLAESWLRDLGGDRCDLAALTQIPRNLTRESEKLCDHSPPSRIASMNSRNERTRRDYRSQDSANVVRSGPRAADRDPSRLGQLECIRGCGDWSPARANRTALWLEWPFR